jgi:hypothetical protein
MPRSPAHPGKDAGGRALMCEKPSCLRIPPSLTSDRSTPKRPPITRFKSTQRQRATPSRWGSGPASTSACNSSFCAAESLEGRPGGFDVNEPVRPVLIEGMHPVAQRLPIHAANTRCLLAVHPVVNRRNRKQSPRLAGILHRPRQHAQFIRIKIIPKPQLPRSSPAPESIHSGQK